MRCKFSPNYILHGEVTRFDVVTRIYTVAFDREDNAGPQQYTEDELQKIISKPVTGIEGISFVPYTDMPVYAYRGESIEKATIHCKRIVSKTQVSVSYAVSNFFSLTELLTESESCLSWKEWGVFSQFLLTVSKI